MASAADEKYELITRRLQEVLGGESIKAILTEGRTPKCYWGATDHLSLQYSSSDCLLPQERRPQVVVCLSTPDLSY